MYLSVPEPSLSSFLFLLTTLEKCKNHLSSQTLKEQGFRVSPQLQFTNLLSKTVFQMNKSSPQLNMPKSKIMRRHFSHMALKTNKLWRSILSALETYNVSDWRQIYRGFRSMLCVIHEPTFSFKFMIMESEV